MDQNTRDYLMFRRMITPAIIQIIFWVFVGVAVLFGVIGVFAGLYTMFAQDFLGGLGVVVSSLVMIVVMPVVIRIYCEILILLFRMNETLTTIANNTSSSQKY